MPRRSYKFRLYPTEYQAGQLATMLETHRRLYNRCLEIRNVAYGSYKLGLGSYDLSNWFKTERRHNGWFASLNYSSVQATMRRLDRAFASFFDRVKKGQKPGYPRFKVEDRWKSVLFPSHGNGIRFKGDSVRIQNVGIVPVRNHRKIKGKIKTLSLKLECGKWFLVLSCQTEDVPIPRSALPAVGIDMGLEWFLATSDGNRVANPRFLRKASDEIRRASRRLARARIRSKQRKKKKAKLQKVHKKVANQRRDFFHKLSRNIVDRHGLIAVEDLRVSNMLRNHGLARSISDAAWAAFLEAVRYKAFEAGAEFVEVDPAWTSQLCSGCGCIVKKDLSVRWHDCPNCGLSICRDVNAARNILLRALGRSGPRNGVEKPNLVLQHGYFLQPSVPPRDRSRMPGDRPGRSSL